MRDGVGFEDVRGFSGGKAARVSGREEGEEERKRERKRGEGRLTRRGRGWGRSR